MGFGSLHGGGVDLDEPAINNCAGELQAKTIGHRRPPDGNQHGVDFD